MFDELLQLALFRAQATRLTLLDLGSLFFGGGLTHFWIGAQYFGLEHFFRSSLIGLKGIKNDFSL